MHGSGQIKCDLSKADFKFFSSRVKHSEPAASASFLRSCTVIGRFVYTEILACLGNVVVISEWELILNRAGITRDQVDATRLIICPKHCYNLTTMYKAKVTNTRNASVEAFFRALTGCFPVTLGQMLSSL